MKTITLPSEMQADSDRLRREGRTIAVVPTMGCLHRGHASLIETARAYADVVVTTVFVNPTQFGPNEDFERYPRDLERDRMFAEAAGSQIIFAPSAPDMYPAGFRTFVEVEGISRILEGAIRPTHFRGVTTVVAKLFTIVKPHVAVLGQKDAQQAFIICRMAQDLNFDIRIIVAPTVRELDGLALSSRNVYLTEQERRNAVVLSRALRHAEERVREGERSAGRLREEMMRILAEGTPSGIDYVAFVTADEFLETETVAPPGVLIACAARFGSTRLIDNTLIELKRESTR